MQDSGSSPSLTAAPTGATEGEVINQNVYGAVRTLAEDRNPTRLPIDVTGFTREGF